jgi:predicted dehydrogenase
VIRAAIIGAGRRGREHAAAVDSIDEIQLVASVDSDPAVAAERAIAQVPGAALLDVVVIATPAANRAKVVAEVLADTGARAVICEKPLALDLGEASWIVDACAAAGVLLAVSHQSRFAESFRTLHRAVFEGTIGRLERLSGACFGNVLDQGSHLIDAMRWVAGTEVEWVMSSAEDEPAILSEQAPAHVGWAPDPGHPAPAWMTHHLSFGHGIRADLETGLLVQRTAPGVGDWLQRRLVAVGTDGLAEAWATGRARVVSFASGVVTEREPSPGDAHAATVGLHRNVMAALQGRAHIEATGADALASLEVALACIQSASSGGLVKLPLDQPRAGAANPIDTARRPAITPGVSVVVNVDDDREFGPEAIASWRHDQGHNGPLELVLVSDGSLPELDRELRGLLDEVDRYVVVPGASRIELYDAGVRAASGEIVVITEAHCAAEPGCVGALVRALHDERVHAAAAGGVVAVARGRFARLDAEIFERGASVYADRADWRKVVPHALAIRRQSFLMVGGFDVRYDLYAEQLLAAELRRAGMPIVRVDEARVRHRFADDPHETLRVMEGFARGQALVRADRVQDEFDRMLFPAGGLDAVEVDRRFAMRAVAGAVSARGMPREFRRWVGTALLPRRLLIAADGLRLGAAVLRARLVRSAERLERTYLDMDAHATRRARRAVVESRGAPLLSGIDSSGVWAAPDLDAGLWSGVHEPEVWNGQRFVWAGPVVALRTDLPEGDWTVVVHTGGFGRDPRTAGLRVRLDGRRLPAHAVSITDRSVTIAVPGRRLRAGRSQCWVIVTNPLMDVGDDDRRLGLTITALELHGSV